MFGFHNLHGSPDPAAGCSTGAAAGIPALVVE
jgi:hypothetical protein